MSPFCVKITMRLITFEADDVLHFVHLVIVDKC